MCPHPTAPRLLESILFSRSCYRVCVLRWAVFLFSMRKLCLPKNASLLRKKPKNAPTTAKRAENKNNKTPPLRKKLKINQKASETSVETKTFIFPLQLCTITLYTSKAVTLSLQHCVCVCVCPKWSCFWRSWGRERLPSRRPSLR